ncbi:hypothetical protein CPB84DRAFT_1764539, partial [Gymnopilus junonius]
LVEPLFSQTLPETLVGLEPLQQAKLQTVLPYLIYDLVFIYLKSRGIDPKTHPVISELDRIRGYFEKINNAENPPAKRAEIDKEAATRFIKHAIAQAKWKKTPAEEAQEEGQGQSSTAAPSSIPVKVTQKMLDRAAYEKELKAQDAMEDEEDGTLEVYNEEDEDNGMQMDVGPDSTRVDSSPTKGKAKETTEPITSADSKKRRRPGVDPFAGYGEDSITTGSPSGPTSTGVKKSKASKSSPLPESVSAGSSKATPQSSQQSTPASTQPSGQDKSKPSTKSKRSKKKPKKPTT